MTDKTWTQKLVWFVIFWLVGVGIVGAVAASIRLVLMTN
ncbi:hypothetical protein H4S14_000640 [Agrobacterium vitis]|nr:hypothetical protein [Agrobacterium vitis]MBE1436913.1 hypothetical protein [Agrobacterium vitis]